MDSIYTDALQNYYEAHIPQDNTENSGQFNTSSVTQATIDNKIPTPSTFDSEKVNEFLVKENQVEEKNDNAIKDSETNKYFQKLVDTIKKLNSVDLENLIEDAGFNPYLVDSNNKYLLTIAIEEFSYDCIDVLLSFYEGYDKDQDKQVIEQMLLAVTDDHINNRFFTPFHFERLGINIVELTKKSAPLKKCIINWFPAEAKKWFIKDINHNSAHIHTTNYKSNSVETNATSTEVLSDYSNNRMQKLPIAQDRTSEDTAKLNTIIEQIKSIGDSELYNFFKYDVIDCLPENLLLFALVKEENEQYERILGFYQNNLEVKGYAELVKKLLMLIAQNNLPFKVFSSKQLIELGISPLHLALHNNSKQLFQYTMMFYKPYDEDNYIIHKNKKIAETIAEFGRQIEKKENFVNDRLKSLKQEFPVSKAAYYKIPNQNLQDEFECDSATFIDMLKTGQLDDNIHYVVNNNLELFSYKANGIKLPKNLTVYGNLTINSRNFVKLPEILHVKSKLMIYFGNIQTDWEQKNNTAIQINDSSRQVLEDMRYMHLKVKYLDLIEIPILKYLPINVEGCEILKLNGCPAVEEIPPCFSNLLNLQVRNCINLYKIPDVMYIKYICVLSDTAINKIGVLVAQSLDISYCKKLTSINHIVTFKKFNAAYSNLNKIVSDQFELYGGVDLEGSQITNFYSDRVLAYFSDKVNIANTKLETSATILAVELDKNCSAGGLKLKNDNFNNKAEIVSMFSAPAYIVNLSKNEHMVESPFRYIYIMGGGISFSGNTNLQHIPETWVTGDINIAFCKSLKSFGEGLGFGGNMDAQSSGINTISAYQKLGSTLDGRTRNVYADGINFNTAEMIEAQQSGHNEVKVHISTLAEKNSEEFATIEEAYARFTTLSKNTQHKIDISKSMLQGHQKDTLLIFANKITGSKAYNDQKTKISTANMLYKIITKIIQTKDRGLLDSALYIIDGNIENCNDKVVYALIELNNLYLFYELEKEALEKTDNKLLTSMAPLAMALDESTMVANKLIEDSTSGIIDDLQVHMKIKSTILATFNITSDVFPAQDEIFASIREEDFNKAIDEIITACNDENQIKEFTKDWGVLNKVNRAIECSNCIYENLPFLEVDHMPNCAIYQYVDEQMVAIPTTEKHYTYYSFEALKQRYIDHPYDIQNRKLKIDLSKMKRLILKSDSAVSSKS